MSLRAALPAEAMKVSPGYPWRLDLDILFDGERPVDWPAWTIRLQIWSTSFRRVLTAGDGLSILEVDLGEAGIQGIPVFQLEADETEELRGHKFPLKYTLDLAEPNGTSSVYFAGDMGLLETAPSELIR